MVKYTVLPLITLAAFSSFTAARNCFVNYNYCGGALLRIGRYEEYIREALKAASQPTDGVHIQKSLFYCSGYNGEIEYLEFCGNRCADSGLANDYCY